MDISDTIAPKSDQLDYVDLLAGPRTFTITGVRRGPSPDQPVQIDLKEFDRPWRPGKTMRRVLVVAWGADAEKYIGRRVTLFGDASVMFGGIAVGGSRISHLSHIEGTLTISLMVKRGKSAPYVVHPLDTPTEKPQEPPVDAEAVDEYLALITETFDLDALRELWKQIDEDGLGKVRALIVATNARKKELASAPAPAPEADYDRQSAAEYQAYLDGQNPEQ